MRRAMLLIVGWTAACGGDFAPASHLADARILALVPTPLEVGPGQPVRVQPFLHIPAIDAASVSESWTFCPISAGVRASFACVVPQCEIDLTPAADGSVTANPTQLALQCLETLANSSSGMDNSAFLDGEMPESVETIFRYTLEAGRTTRTGIARVPLFLTGPPDEPNLPPTITEITVGGMTLNSTTATVTVSKLDDLEITVEIEEGSLQSYTSELGEMTVEKPTVSFFTTAGQFSPGLDGQIVSRSNLEPLKDETAVGDATLIYTVARDGRGGQAVRGPIRVRTN